MKSKSKNMKQLHDELVGNILAETSPVRGVSSAASQWFLWLGISIATTGLFLVKMGMQDMGQVINRMPPVVFLVLAFLGASLAAWEAIASSLPGRSSPRGRGLLSLALVAALYLMPFLFFSRGQGEFHLIQACCNGWGCIEGCSFSGLVPWLFLGGILARNASFKPFWTGAWSGVSAFLMGTFTVQLHCPSWETGHMFAAHLLPVAFFTLLASFIGAFWFSRWRR